MSEPKEIQELITSRSRRLHFLKQQQAIRGFNTPPEILMEIEDIEAELEKLQKQLKAIEAIQGQTTQPSKEDKSPKKNQIPKLFYSYAHKDELLRDKLAIHLKILERQGKIDVWYDREIGAGEEWEIQIKMHLNTADIILLLISPDFMASDFCYDIEMNRAIERHDAGEAVVIPVILRPTDWAGAPFGKLQALPKNAKPVTQWKNEDEALLDIAQGVRKVADRLMARLSH
jgi:hypothetical protein